QPQTTRGHAEHALPILPHNFAIGRCSPDSSGNVLHAMSPDHRHNQSGHSKARGLCQIQHANSWIRIYELPSFVTFSHRTHLLHGATCQECHGPVAERTQLYKENDISMASCVA